MLVFPTPPPGLSDACVHPRIIGGEKEYEIRDIDTSRLIIRSRYDQRDQWLRNGARWYLDINNHPEYAAPECTSGLASAKYDFAGDLHAYNAAVNAGLAPTSLLVANNLGIAQSHPPEFTTWASHDSYLTCTPGDDSHMSLKLRIDRLAAFQISFILITGNGCFLPAEDWKTYQFHFSERSVLVQSLKDQAGRGRNIFLLRDEPLVKAHGYHRLQVINNDSNLLFEPVWLRRTLMDLMLLMDEHGIRHLPYFPDDKSAVAALHAFNQQAGQAPTVKVIHGDKLKSMTALKIQQAHLAAAAYFVKQHGLVQYQPAISAWRELLRLLAERNLPALARHLGWAARLQLARDKEQKLGRRMTGYEAWSFGFTTMTVFSGHPRYQLQHPRTGQPYHHSPLLALRRRLLPQTLLQEIDTLRLNPPTDTRAYLRHRLIDQATKHGWEFSGHVDWTNHTVKTPRGEVPFRFDSPYQTHHPALESWLITSDQLAA